VETDRGRRKGVIINLAQLVAEQRRLVAHTHAHTHSQVVSIRVFFFVLRKVLVYKKNDQSSL
jgi:hypothetical protein